MKKNRFPYVSLIICLCLFATVISGTVAALRANYGTYLKKVLPVAAAEGQYANADLIKADGSYEELKNSFYGSYPYALASRPEVREKFTEKFLKIEPKALEKYPWLQTSVSEADKDTKEFDDILWKFIDLLDEKFIIYPNRGIYYRTSTGAIPFAKF